MLSGSGLTALLACSTLAPLLLGVRLLAVGLPLVTVGVLGAAALDFTTSFLTWTGVVDPLPPRADIRLGCPVALA